MASSVRAVVGYLLYRELLFTLRPLSFLSSLCPACAPAGTGGSGVLTILGARVLTGEEMRALRCIPAFISWNFCKRFSCNGFIGSGASSPWRSRASSNNLASSVIRPASTSTLAASPCSVARKSGLKKASLYLLIPPFTAASMVPVRIIVNGRRSLVWSLVNSRRKRPRSAFFCWTVSQANWAGLTRLASVLTTSNHLRMPGNCEEQLRVDLSIHNVFASFCGSGVPRWKGRSNKKLDTLLTE